ncbi:poly(beta-D-mannuronate) C5 epimerase [Devosia sp. UYZn731]|uniref:right-handed parallel beta-helix repeat-containing protein n=1 Tax=Devosia sp. UYZn731 TaxID=3156345 RepID=UPI003394E8BE
MRKGSISCGLGIALLLAPISLPANAGQLTGLIGDIEVDLERLASAGGGTAKDYLALVAPLGFSEEANYNPELSIHFPEPSASAPIGKLLPLPLVLDAVLDKTSSHALDSINDAQGEHDSAIYFEHGPVFLKDIAAAAAAQSLPATASDTATLLTLKTPLLLSSQAVLVLRAGEQLTLDRASGAFVIAAGGVVLDRAAIIGSEPANPNEKNFRPFVFVSATGPVEVAGGTFEGLGFGGDPYTAGLSISGQAADADAHSFVLDSHFTRTGSLSLVDVRHSTISSNVFAQSLGNAIAISNSNSIIVDGNAIVGAADSHGMKIGPSSESILVSDNLVVGSGRHGLLLQGDNAGTTVFNNMLFNNKGSGVAVLEGACISLEQNVALNNAADGIMVRNSSSLSVKANYISGNARAGVSIVGNAGTMAIADNQFDANKVGLRVNASRTLVLSNNNWSGQTPRLLDGDIAQYTLPLLAGIKAGQTSLTMAGLSSPQAKSDSATSCKPGQPI